LVSSITAIASIVIALAALGFTIFSFNRQQTNAHEQQVQAERLAVSGVRPLLRINSQSYVNLKSLSLSNHGLGPAIVKVARFDRASLSPTSNVVDLFDHILTSVQRPQGRLFWETYQDVWSGLALPAQDRILLIKESSAHLTGQGMSQGAALDLLQQWQDARIGLKVHIEYNDILGNEMEPLDFTFS
jgi:hypothetical protein